VVAGARLGAAGDAEGEADDDADLHEAKVDGSDADGTAVAAVALDALDDAREQGEGGELERGDADALQDGVADVQA